jgi:hypothetical protein
MKTSKGQVIDLALVVSRPEVSAPANKGHPRPGLHFTCHFAVWQAEPRKKTPRIDQDARRRASLANYPPALGERPGRRQAARSGCGDVHLQRGFEGRNHPQVNLFGPRGQGRNRGQAIRR